MQLTKQTTNGSNGHFDLVALQQTLAQLKKPGRPSKEVVALRNQVEELIKLQSLDIIKAPAPKVSKKAKAQLQIVEEPTVKKAKTKAVVEKPSTRAIYVAPIVQEAIEVEVSGISQLIQHAWDAKTIREMEEKQQGTVGVAAKKDGKGKPIREFRNPRREWDAARYRDHKKNDCAPAVQFKKCMVSAASRIPGVTMKDINTAVFVKSVDHSDLIPLKFDGKEPVMRTDMVKIGNFPNKIAQPRYRPGYSNWSCKLRVEYDASVMSPDQVVNLLNRGGFGVGIAEWRPEKGGEFGRFKVVNVRNVR